MVAAEEPTRIVSVGVSPERCREVRSVVDRVTRGAEECADIVGVLLVGSYERGAARPDSDVDLVLLTQDVDGQEIDAWVDDLGVGELIGVKAWGVLAEHRFVTPSGLDVEIGVSSRDWARTDPVDAGTRRVVADGA